MARGYNRQVVSQSAPWWMFAITFYVIVSLITG
jgi:hypothetical protein